jgi:hypothetical protein
MQKNTLKNPIPFHNLKRAHQNRNTKEFPQHDKGYLILKKERLKGFSIRSGKRKHVPTFLIAIQHCT